MADREQMVFRQKALAEFGEPTLRSDSLDKVLQEACRIVADALETDLAKVLEIQPETQELLVKAGIGWKPGSVGQTRILMGEWSSEAYAIETAEPVIMIEVKIETQNTGTMQLQVRDSGKGLSSGPREARPGSGTGLRLIGALAFRSRPNPSGPQPSQGRLSLSEVQPAGLTTDLDPY